jgi:hypothetical protein
MIALAESRVYRDLRATTMEKPLSVVVSSNAAALPADLIELNEVYFSGGQPLQVITLDRYRTLSAIGVPNGATTCVCAQDGDTLRFWPAATGTVLGSYYAKPDPLETITWANATTFARYPELFLYATHGGSHADPRHGGQACSCGRPSTSRRSITQPSDERMRVYGGSPLRIRTR